MTDVDFQPEDPESGQQECLLRLLEDVAVELDDDPLLLLADVALAPLSGDSATCSFLEAQGMEMSLRSMQLQLHFFLDKADDLHSCLVNGQGHLETDALAAAVMSFLCTCQPFFNHLESTVRRSRPQHTALPLNIHTQASTTSL
ncbi:hypothetical protein Q5P01_025031 [Channa striata]|uniref:Uncharacterized protein n=1 Tax=Channa striata TaxID=64152 RepID=A0AA88LGZ9_CHASR|nr:hypothetical protein Q5P01_025031 [Channa striata]